MILLVFGLCFDIFEINSESHLEQDRKIFLANGSSILLSFFNPEVFIYLFMVHFLITFYMYVWQFVVFLK